MLARRLRVPAEALKDLRGFVKRSSPFFVLRSAPNSLPHPRFAVVAGAKVDRRAVERHKLKRRATEHLLRLNRSGEDIVLVLLPPAAKLPRKAFFEELGKLLDSNY